MQHPNLNSHISTLENLLVEGLCPWQGDWILIIFKITPILTIPSAQKGIWGFFSVKLSFLSQSAQWSTWANLPVHEEPKDPTAGVQTQSLNTFLALRWKTGEMFAMSQDYVNTKLTATEDKKEIWASMRDIPHGVKSAAASPQEALESSPTSQPVSLIRWRVFKSGAGLV